MNCEFQSLYFSNEGYVVRCKQCGYYQVAFMTTIISLSDKDFLELSNVVKCRSSEEDYSISHTTKSIIIPTPCAGVCLFLTRREAKQFNNILQEADNEEKALSLISLFN